MLLIFLKTLLIGFSASIGIGPVTVLVMKKGIGEGFKPSFISGLGSAIIDSFYGTLAFLGVGLVVHFLNTHAALLRIGIMIILIIVAIFLWRSKTEPAVLAGLQTRKPQIGGFLSTMGLALSNPFMILVFLSIFSIIPITADGEQRNSWIAVAFGLLSGTALWWFTLSGALRLFRKRLPKFLAQNLNKIAGVLLFLLAIVSGILGLVELFAGN